VILAATGTGVVLLELGAIILVLGILGRLAGRVRLSPVPLYLGVGLLLGPDAPLDLGASAEFIETAAAIGVALLLFLLGLEYTADELFSTLRAQAPAGAVDLALNFVPGLLAGLLLGWSPLEAFVLGGVTYISSSGIIAKLLGDLGRLGNRETPVILSILVIEDLVMAFYLPLTAGLLAGGSALATGTSVVVAVVVVIAVMVGVRWLGPAFSRLVLSESSEVLLFTVLGLTLFIAGLAEELQVSAAVGAFLVGIALSGPAAERAEPLLLPLRDLFAASFFVFFGLQIDLGGVPGALPVAAALAVVTAATKLFTGWWAAGRAGVGRRGRWRAGATLIPRGEFSVIIAGLAAVEGVGDDLAAVTAAYVLILAVAGPVAARVIDPLLARSAPAAGSPGT
jgi:CPA2 family monovalent cation:H+ antiporter-2